MSGAGTAAAACPVTDAAPPTPPGVGLVTSIAISASESIERTEIESCEVRLGFLNILSESRASWPRWLSTSTVSDDTDVWPLTTLAPLGVGEGTIIVVGMSPPALVPLPMLIPLLLLVVLPPRRLLGPLWW